VAHPLKSVKVMYVYIHMLHIFFYSDISLCVITEQVDTMINHLTCAWEVPSLIISWSTSCSDWGILLFSSVLSCKW